MLLAEVGCHRPIVDRPRASRIHLRGTHVLLVLGTSLQITCMIAVGCRWPCKNRVKVSKRSTQCAARTMYRDED